jgi:hypothetical protein
LSSYIYNEKLNREIMETTNSQKQRVIDFIRNQKQRHKSISFQEELQMFKDRYKTEQKRNKPVKMVEKIKTNP